MCTTHTLTTLTTLTDAPVVAARPTPLHMVTGHHSRSTLHLGVAVATAIALVATDIVVVLVHTGSVEIQSSIKGQKKIENDMERSIGKKKIC